MKVKRQSKILEIIRNSEICTQEEIAEELNREGYNVTQATVSRDIRELGIIKISTGGGKQKYGVMSGEDTVLNEKFKRVFKEGVTSIDYAQNIIVIKTITGMAMAVAAALDAMGEGEIMGSLAGDDTVFCVTKNEDRAVRLVKRLKSI